MLCSELCISFICAASFPTRACTSCNLSEIPCVCDAILSIFALSFAVASPTLFCSVVHLRAQRVHRIQRCCTSVRIDALFASTALRIDCCPCNSCEICSCSWIISFETAPVGRGLSMSRPPPPPITAHRCQRDRSCAHKSLLPGMCRTRRNCGSALTPKRAHSTASTNYGPPRCPLLRRYEVRAAIFLPAALRLFGAERTFLAPAHGVHAIRRRCPARSDNSSPPARAVRPSRCCTRSNRGRRNGLRSSRALAGTTARIPPSWSSASRASGRKVGFVEIKERIFHVLLEQFAHARLLVVGVITGAAAPPSRARWPFRFRPGPVAVIV